MATGTLAAAGPWIVSEARSSSGTLRIMMWSDYLPDPFIERFMAETGIRVEHTPYGSNEQLISKLKSTRGRGYDLVSPTSMRMRQWQPLDLLQPWDMSRVPSERIDEAMLALVLEVGTWGGQSYHLPFVWGAEGMAWRTDKWTRDYRDLSYGDLWLPEMKGKVMGRPHSMMLGIGLYLDRIGELPSDRMLDSYRDEDTMRGIWTRITEFALEQRPWVKHFWNDADAQIAGFMQNGVILGQTWDGPLIRLKTAGRPVTFMAPREGALGWIDGLSMPVGARNVDAVYAFLDFAYRPEVGALFANETGYNSVANGSRDYLTPAARSAFSEAYPDDALARIWWWPPEPVWYARARAEFRDKFVAA